GDDPREPERRGVRGTAGARRARLQRAALPRGGALPPRQRLPLRGLRADARGRGAARGPRGPPARRAGGRVVPKRTDIESILLIGAGAIVIGAGVEFHYCS